MPFDLGRSAPDQPRIDAPLFLGVSPEQCAIANDVDKARHALDSRNTSDLAPDVEYFAQRPRDFEPMLDVARCFLTGQRLEVVAPCDALRKLAQIVPASRSRSSGWPIRMICNSFCLAVSRLVSRRTCSSTAGVRFCASSTTSIVRRPSACAFKRCRLSASVSALTLPCYGPPRCAALRRLSREIRPPTTADSGPRQRRHCRACD